jgi:hypothetical protein
MQSGRRSRDARIWAVTVSVLPLREQLFCCLSRAGAAQRREFGLSDAHAGRELREVAIHPQS